MVGVRDSAEALAAAVAEPPTAIGAPMRVAAGDPSTRALIARYRAGMRTLLHVLLALPGVLGAFWWIVT